jgi:uncharacterized repeat protein (TIGR01451 family)
MTSIRTTSARAALAAAVAAVALLAVASPASARKVATPGPFTITATGGALKIGTMDPSDLTPAPGATPVSLTGSITASGAVTVPKSNIVFPPQSFESSVGTATVSIVPTSDATGTLNPITGAGTLQIRFYITITGISLLGNNCTIGTAGSPIVLNMTTGTSGSRTGVPYSAVSGTVTEVDGLFAVPGASNCSLGTSTVNSEIGLPSPSGNNYLDLATVVSPAPQPGVVARFTAAPSSGPAPLTTAFDASASTATGAAQYRWDWTNDGVTDLTTSNPTDPAASHVYTQDGTYTARLTVVDGDGDQSTATRTILVAVPHPDAAITTTAAATPFRTGQPQEYVIGVANDGSLPTSGATTVSDALPVGMAYTGFTGTGWDCTEVFGVVTCTYAASLAIGETAPELRLQVTPGEDAVGLTTNTASVQTADDQNPSNDSASATVETLRSGVDLAIVKSHDAEEGLLRGRRATWTLQVGNRGTTEATSRSRVEDVLPDRVTLVSASGPGWTCDTSALPTVRCFSDQDAAPGADLAPLTIRVEVDSDAPGILQNTATLTNEQDTALTNNASTDIGNVQGYGADFELGVTHSDPFLRGQPGTYTITARNVGTRTAGSTVTVTDTLPAGLAPTGMSGDGWGCSAAGQAVTCTHAGPVEAGNALPALTIAVSVAPATADTVVNDVLVSSPDDANGANDQVLDTTNVRSPAPDLAMDVSHAATRFVAGDPGVYDLAVSNVGSEPTGGPVTITDTLPAGLTYTSATGAGWSCAAAGQVVTCDRTGPRLEPGTTSHVTLTVAVASAAQPAVVNTAAVATPGDTNAANNADSDPTAVGPSKKATVLTAEQAVLTITTNGLKITTGIDGLRATLKSATGTPLAGRRLAFTLKNGFSLCEATTDAAGVAKCAAGVVSLVGVTTNLSYTVRFAGDDEYLASSATAGILQIGGIRL